MKRTSRPKKLTNTTSSHDTRVEGWWYENARSIDVFLRDADGKRTYSGRIRRSILADWLKRTA